MNKSNLLLVSLCIGWSSVLAQPQTPSGYIQRDLSRKEVIVFVHGVLGDAKDTWTNEHTKAYWPSLVRSDQTFAAANVWVFSYYSPKIGNAQSIEELATKLGDEMRAQDVFQSHDRVYFIAHSMGGLITREMLTRQLPPASKVPLIYFFGTPSTGANLAGVAAAISANPQFANMRPFTRQSDVEGYGKRWLATAENANARYPQRIWSFCAYEIEPFVAKRLIVEESSASYLCSTEPRASRANHVTMVKPKDTTAEAYSYFVSAYKFANTPVAKFAATSDAIRPGIRTTALELRSAEFADGMVQVGCNQTATGNKRLQVALEPSQRLIAVKPIVHFESGFLERSLDAAYDATGSVTLGYKVQGKPPGFFSGCQTGQARVGIQYLMEAR